MAEVAAGDVSVVIATRDRWNALGRVLEALSHQTVKGFETIVVVDGTRQRVPDLPDVNVVVKDAEGRAAALNAGVGAASRPVVLFLADDVVPAPQLVEAHVGGRRSDPDDRLVLVGQVLPRPDPLEREVDRLVAEASRAGFDASNASIARDFFLGSGGFDARLTALAAVDLCLRCRASGILVRDAPGAVGQRIGRRDLERVRRRLSALGHDERMLQRTHASYEPAIQPVMSAAAQRRPTPVRPAVTSRQSLRRDLALVAPACLAGWEGARDLDELREYLGAEYDERLLRSHVDAVEREEEAAADELGFYRSSQMYLYDLTAFAMTGTKWPYLADLQRFVPPGRSVLDWGCGIGTDGLRLLDAGYDVAFADFDNPSTRYLRWRLERRGRPAPVYDIEADAVPDGFDAAYALDVIEHVEDPYEFLSDLERRAAVVMVNFLELDPDDTHLHRPLPIAALLDRAARMDLLRYRRYHQRSHLVIYRPRPPRPIPGVRSLAQRHLGARLGTG